MIHYCLTSYGADLVILDVLNDEFSLLLGAGELLGDRVKLQESFPQLSMYFDNEYFIGSRAYNKQRSFLEERWMLPATDLSSYRASAFQRLMMIVEVMYYSKKIEKHGMAWIYKKCLENKLRTTALSLETERIVSEEMSKISSIFYTNLFKSDCLTYSFTLKKRLACRNVAARLIIGIRTQPFYSHAWVEVDGKVINDDPNLRDKLSVIAEI